MTELVRKHVAAVPDFAIRWVLAAGSVASFSWLLLSDQIHPLVVYFLQFYLTF